MTCFSAPHSQTVEGAIPHLCYKQEQKHPTPVLKAVELDPCCSQQGFTEREDTAVRDEVQSLLVFSNHSAFHWLFDQNAKRMIADV